MIKEKEKEKKNEELIRRKKEARIHVMRLKNKHQVAGNGFVQQVEKIKTVIAVC